MPVPLKVIIPIGNTKFSGKENLLTAQFFEDNE
jgi:hypothetical protein